MIPIEKVLHEAVLRYQSEVGVRPDLLVASPLMVRVLKKWAHQQLQMSLTDRAKGVERESLMGMEVRQATAPMGGFEMSLSTVREGQRLVLHVKLTPDEAGVETVELGSGVIEFESDYEELGTIGE